MENFFSRYKNPLVLMAILFIQVVALATQVKRPKAGEAEPSGGTRLIRVWTVTTISPFERFFVATGAFVRRNFHNYIDLHDARQQNRELQDEVARLKLEQVRLRQDAEQARRLQSLLGFTQRYVGQLVPAQVIGTSGSEQSHLIQIDKGSRNANIKVDMPVITPDGIVGKVKDVFPYTSQVLMISDRDGGAGVILQNSRLQGILRGSPTGELRVSDIMADEKIDEGEEVVTSGGDRIYPKGLPVGTVTQVYPDRDNDTFLFVRVKPAADLNRLEEVLVVTRVSEEAPQQATAENLRAADILSARLPSVPKQDASKKGDTKTGVKPTASPSPTPQAGAASPFKPAPASGETKKAPASSGPADVAAKKGTAQPGATTSATTAAGTATKTPVPATSPSNAAGKKSATSNGTSSSQVAATPTTASGQPSPKKTPAAIQGNAAASAPQQSGAKTGATGAPSPATAGAQKSPAPVKKSKPAASPTPTPGDTAQPAPTPQTETPRR